MHNVVNYEIVEAGDGNIPELVLVDGESNGGAEEWQQAKQTYPHAKVVYFAAQPPAFTAPYLAKPIQFDTLFTNLRNLLQGNGVWVAGMADKAEAAGMARPQHAAQARQEAVSIDSFATEGTLLGFVQQLAAQGQDVAVAVNGKPALVLFPSIQKVLLAVDPSRIQELCNQTGLSLESKAVPANPQLQEKAKIKIQAFIWQLAIWTAQGRLIEPIRPDTVLKLTAWPNMTRMAYLPESMRISAFLIKTPASLSMLYKLLPLDMNDILNFIAAAHAIGYLEFEQSAQPHTAQETVVQRPAAAVLERPAPADEAHAQAATHTSAQAEQGRGGLLQRLMGRLRGK
ncbi:hypothetical protein L1281_001190 [Neisseria sp. HSC-16F19]|nr:alpha-glucan phosphorylase [Neisseria sp. HSC-16F19]MCP2040607.1 hypothetical protein [Neisseria sp. HSC-16F19]